MSLSSPAQLVLRLTDVRKTYSQGAQNVHALAGITLDITRGSFTAVMGPSGSGKSTFLHCVAGLDAPSSGKIIVGDTDITALTEAQLTNFRRDRVGFVFQAYNLLPQLTVNENLGLPSMLAGKQIDRVRRDQLLAAVGLAGKGERLPGELSGGQTQRVAIARSLMTTPEVLFADEPTGALDSHTGQEILQLFKKVAREAGQTVVLVTHDPVVAAQAERVIFLADGKIAGQLMGSTAEQISHHIVELGRNAA